MGFLGLDVHFADSRKAFAEQSVNGKQAKRRFLLTGSALAQFLPASGFSSLLFHSVYVYTRVKISG